jgi:hypothetical protein
LESVYTGNRIVGSNPTPSATAIVTRCASPAEHGRRPRPASRCQTARRVICARSPSRSRGACSASGLPRRSFSLSPPHLSAASAGASAGSRPYPWRQLQLRPRNEGPAERREAYHLKIVAPVRRDLTLARRARPAQPGRPPLGAPPWRCPGPAASPAFAPEPGQGWLAGHRSWPATDPGFDRGYEPRPTPHPAPPSGSSPEDAPHERGWESLYYIFVK